MEELTPEQLQTQIKETLDLVAKRLLNKAEVVNTLNERLKMFKCSCPYCGKKLYEPYTTSWFGGGPNSRNGLYKVADFEVDHITPRNRGGTDMHWNLIICCSACNSSKKDLTAFEFGHYDIQKLTRDKPQRDLYVEKSNTYIYQIGIPKSIADFAREEFYQAGGITQWFVNVLYEKLKDKEK